MTNAIESTHFDQLNDLATEVIDEAVRQTERWGVQTRPHLFHEGSAIGFAKSADRWKQINDAREAEDKVSWDGVLIEETFEAACEVDLEKRRVELIQVAAVCLSEIADLDRKLAEQEALEDCPVTGQECEQLCEPMTCARLDEQGA